MDQDADLRAQGHAILTGMARILREAVAGPSKAALGHACLSVVQEVTHSPLGFIGMVNPDTGVLEDIAVSDGGLECPQMPARAGPDQPLSVGFDLCGFCARVLSAGQGLIADDLPTPVRTGARCDHPPLGAFLGMPLIHAGQPIGLVGLGNREGGYGPAELGAIEGLVPAIVQVLLANRAAAVLRERAQLLADVQSQQALLDAVIEHLPVGIGIAEAPSGRLLRINERTREIWRMDTMAAASPSEYGQYIGFHPDGRRYVPEDWQLVRALQGEVIRGEEVAFLRGDGACRIMRSNAAPVLDAHGHTIAAVVVIDDITEHKRTEDALREKDRLLSESQRIAHIGSWIYDRVGQITWSEETYRLWGVDPDTFIPNGETFEQLIHPDDRLAMRAWIATCMAGERPDDLVFRRVLPDGRLRYLCGRGELKRDAEGRPIHMAGTVQDITERKQIEDVQAFLAQTSSTATDASFFHALARHLAERLGVFYVCIDRLEGDGLNARTLAIWCDGHFEDNMTYALRDTPCGEAVSQAVCCFPAQVRQRFPRDQALQDLGAESYLGATLRDHAGAPIGLIALIWRAPLDQRSLAETILKQVAIRAAGELERLFAEEALREVDRRKDEFLATLAHELRNPLAPLRTGLDLLRLRGQGPEIAGRAQAMMERQLAHLVRLVDDLLDVSRITRGKIELRREPVDLCETVRAAMEVVSASTLDTQRQLVARLPNEPLTVGGDPVRLAQSVGNLLNNAIKFTNVGGHIWLTLGRDGGEAKLSVRDDGEGIPADQRNAIFELFAQAHPTRRGGLGIGLALVRSLVQLHGGQVEARSDGPGQGSEFVIRLPLLEVAPTPLLVAAEPAVMVPLSRQILVVDDHPDIADSLGILLRLLGAQVRIVYNGAQALEAFSSERPDVVFLDLGLPDMDGYEVARRMRAHDPTGSLVLVAVTGWGAEQDRRRVQLAGFDHHLIKPASLDDLQAVLGRSFAA
ncbi:ATP-binding protein [uncultured Thiodictyon sp.]|uniref:ATP-binding protein n=1 Tax=uncultured Thiodictyon sp. TaxID=1846217 RepID=UPI0025CCEB60|nr:ATP-binding protein [uncultured Thiodictyon sp.]